MGILVSHLVGARFPYTFILDPTYCHQISPMDFQTFPKRLEDDETIF